MNKRLVSFDYSLIQWVHYSDCAEGINQTVRKGINLDWLYAVHDLYVLVYFTRKI